MAVDDLSAPLGQASKKRRRVTVPVIVPQAVAGALGSCLLVFVLWALLADNPFGGEPIVVVAVGAKPSLQAGNDGEASAPKRADAAGPSVVGGDKAGEAGGRTVTIIDGMSGKRQEVVIAPNADPGKGTGIDQRLIESSPRGAIPKIAPDGTRPADAYARPAKAGADAIEGPRIAVVMDGLGISASGTTEALAKLPGAITLGFSPYGTDIERWVNRARSEGHEVLLQVSMEPFDYPDNDPGPHALLTSLAPDQNLDRLHWFMSRFQGYVGIVNYMGARFTSNEPSVSMLLRETIKRGLIYVDDGTAPRSLASQLASAVNAPFAKADVVLDAVPSPAEIDAALARLEAIARERGFAVGVAGALPVSISRISQWAKIAQGRGIVLVPISAVATKPKST